MKTENIITQINKSNLSRKEKDQLIEILSNKKFSKVDIVNNIMRILSISSHLIDLFDNS